MPSEEINRLLKLQKYYNDLHKLGKKALESIAAAIRIYNDLKEMPKLDIKDLYEESNEISFHFVGINFYVRIEHNFNEGKLLWGIKYFDRDEEIRNQYVEHKFDHLGNLEGHVLITGAGKLVVPVLDKIIHTLRTESPNQSIKFE
jgi:hypothetical protein